MIPISQAYGNPANRLCDSQYATVLDMTAGTQYILLGIVLAIGLGLLYLYFKMNSTLEKTSETLGEISDLFDTLE